MNGRCNLSGKSTFSVLVSAHRLPPNRSVKRRAGSSLLLTVVVWVSEMKTDERRQIIRHSFFAVARCPLVARGVPKAENAHHSRARFCLTYDTFCATRIARPSHRPKQVES